MWGIIIILLIGLIIGLYFKSKSQKVEADKEIINSSKKDLYFKNLPDLAKTKEIYGKRFDELIEILSEADPIKIGYETADKKDYNDIARLIIYKIDSLKTRDRIEDIIIQEFKIWFSYDIITFDLFDELIDSLFDWNNKWFYRQDNI